MLLAYYSTGDKNAPEICLVAMCYLLYLGPERVNNSTIDSGTLQRQQSTAS